MLSCLRFLPVFILLTLLTACGGDSSTVDATTIPGAPSDIHINVEVNGKLLIGGSLQSKGSVFSPVGTVSTFAGIPGTAGSSDTDITTGMAASFNQPLGITTDGTNLYVADYLNNAIRKIDIATQKVTLFAGNPLFSGSTDGTGTLATFNRPTAITTDGTNLYVTDDFTIRQIVISTQEVTTIAGLAGTQGAVDATLGANARFNYLYGITTDGTNLYVTDSYNTIRKIVINTGATTTLAGTAGSAGSTDGTGAAARFSLPARITTDGTYLYVTDFYNRTIRRISIATGEVKTIIGNSEAPPARTDATGAGTAALFYQLNGITMDATNLYVTDSYNNTVYKIQKDSPWSVTKLAGITGTAGHTDTANGTPTFDTPIGITSDGTSLYVTDSRNHTIRKIE